MNKQTLLLYNINYDGYIHLFSSTKQKSNNEDPIALFRVHEAEDMICNRATYRDTKSNY